VKFAVIIPAFNEAATISRVVNDVRDAGTVIVVDDASLDATAALAEEAGAVVVRHDSNKGYDGALETGFEKARQLGMDSVISFDADGQHDPSVLNNILTALKDPQVFLVLGIRPHAARFSEVIFNYWAKVRFGVTDILCGLKGYHMDLYLQHGCFDHTGSVGTELALAGLRRGCHYSTVTVPISPRAGTARFGSTLKANYQILRALKYAIYQDLRDFLRRRFFAT